MATVWTSQTEVTITGACCDYVVTIGGSELLKVKNPLILLGGSGNGAGDGNRTHVASLMAQYLINGQYSAVVNRLDSFKRYTIVLYHNGKRSQTARQAKLDLLLH